ncbi:hypothetical protein A2W57_02260 [Candidatus Giovannonibacteria bacterium RIFCSPHIGHO2_02_43_16]|nr:MAG: hypothetical protein A2W57_02260 [Candidatus Giovannonibacteria bacterium RIFCSPHIGHO2_02_43_16]
MPHISKRRIKRKIYKKLNDNLVNVFLNFHSKSDVAHLVNDLLTYTERIMVSKRIAIILMLNEGYSFRAIESALKVTLQTVLRFWKMKKKGRFGSLAKKTAKGGDLWKDLENILQAGLPPRGRGRWKHVFDAMGKADRVSRSIYRRL